MRLSSVLVAVCVVLLYCGIAQASRMNESDTLKCRNSIVSVGNTVADLIEKCGEPKYIVNNGWFYDFGRNEFLYEVKIRNNRVHKIINTREYGTK